MKRNKRKGFTLVEIMIVVLIIGILLAIAVPNFVKARETSRAKTCMGNLKQIESAKEQACMEGSHDTSWAPGQADLSPDYVKTWPACPSGGAYTIGDMSTRPVCATAGHALP